MKVDYIKIVTDVVYFWHVNKVSITNKLVSGKLFNPIVFNKMKQIFNYPTIQLIQKCLVSQQGTTRHITPNQSRNINNKI